MDSLAGGDRSKWDYFLNMKVVEFLNTLAFNKDKAEYEQMKNERMWRTLRK